VRAEGLNARLRAVLGAALIVMSGFLASKLLGFVRNVVISYQYGATREYETFLAAITLPDTLFQVLAGGAVAAAFIPVFTGYLAEGSTQRAWRLTSALINLAIVGIGTVAIVIGIAAPVAMGLLVAGWSAEDQQRAAHLARIMIVSPVIFAVSALVTSVLNGVKRFALAALAPLMYNASLICGAIFLREHGAEGLAISAVVGALLHLLIQVPGLILVGMRYSPTFGLDLAGTREVGRLMVPRVIGLGVAQLNQLVNVALASFLVAGSIAYLNYAWLILMVPLGVFGMAISTAVFPTLAEQAERDKQTPVADRTDRDEEAVTFVFVLRLILYLTVPAAVALIVFGRPIVSLVLERGAFLEVHAAATAVALTWYAIGLPGHGVIEIVDRVFYAERDTATPVKVAAAAVAINIALSLVLMRTPLSFGGLALANSLAALAEAFVLAVLLHRRTGWIPGRTFLRFGWRIGLAALTMGVVAMLLQGVLAGHVEGSQAVGRATIFIVAGGLSALVYVGVSEALGISDARRVAGLLRTRG
jgi:putative peptidoglycan lipid II flippase